MSLMAANEESDPSAILNGFWVTLSYIKFHNLSVTPLKFGLDLKPLRFLR